VEDEASIDLEFVEGSGHIELSWTATDRRNEGVITGTLAEITIYDDRLVIHNVSNERELHFEDRLTQSSYHPQWFQEFFQRTVFDKDKGPAARNFIQASLLVSIVDALYRSAREGGRRQQLSSPDGLTWTGEESRSNGSELSDSRA
jgi:hypothetical protein